MVKEFIKNIKLIIIIIVIVCIFGWCSSYAATTSALTENGYAIHSENVEYADKSDLGVTQVQAAIDGTCTKIDERLSNLESINLDKIYPVGSIYLSTSLSDETQVADALGGTWEPYGKGRTLVGDDGTSYLTGDTDKGTGGSTTVSTKLSVDNMPSHTHDISHTHTTLSTTTSTMSLTAGGGAHSHALPSSVVKYDQSVQVGTGAIWYAMGQSLVTATNSDGEHTHKVTGNVTIPSLKTNSISTQDSGEKGSGEAFETSTMQPYIVVYMYRRTS